jgi:cytochrome c oxidase assembly protein subunit 15
MTLHATRGNNRMTRGLHRFTLTLVVATLLLLIAGALVTSHDAGLATSDWPLSNGQWFPKMVGNLFWEHGHRMVATTVGFLTLVFALHLHRWTLWRVLKRLAGSKPVVPVQPNEPPLWLRRLGLVALAAVIAQGLLGGLTVKLMLPLAVSAAHATLAQLFFCTVVTLAVLTSAGWNRDRRAIDERGGLPLRQLAVAAAATVFLQLILGATLRHSAPWDRDLPTELVVAHVGGAIAVLVVLGGTALTVLRRYPNEKYLTRPAIIALALLFVQLLLGLIAYLTRLASPFDPQPLNPMIWMTVAHVVCGALVFATTIVLALRSFKLLRATASGFELAHA